MSKANLTTNIDTKLRKKSASQKRLADQLDDIVTEMALEVAVPGTGFTGTNATGTLNSNGLQLSVALGGGGGSINFSAGTLSSNLASVVFSNSNGVSFGLNGATLTATVATNYQSQGAYLTTAQPVGAYLTTAALSNHSHNFATTTTNGESIIVATTNSNGATIAVPAYLTTAQPVGAYLTTGALSNHSHNFATTTTNGASIIVATTNSNGATIAVPAYLTTAQPVGAYLTTARASNDAIGLNSALTANGVSMTANSSGLSLNFPAFLTTAALSNHSHNFATTTTNGSLIVVATTNSAGATIAVPAYLTTAQAPGAYLTTARASNDGIGLNTAQTNVTWTVNSSGLSINASGYAGIGTSATNASITLNSNGLAISVAAPGGGGAVNFSAGTTSQNLQSVVFANANGITFGLGTGGSSQSITASHNGLTTAAASDHSHGNPTLALTNLSGTTASASNGFTLSLSAGAAGGGATISTYIPYYPASTGVQTMGAQGVTSASAWFFPVSIQDAVMFNRIEQLMTASWISTTVAASNTITHQFGIFSNNAGTLSLISSSSYSVAASASTVSATVSYPSAYGTAGGYTYTTVGASSTATAQSLFGTAGNRVMTFGFGNTMELSAGLYWLGIHQRQSSVGAAAGMAFALAGNVMGAIQSAGALGSSTAAFTGTANTLVKIPWGVATSTGSAGYGGSQLPSDVNITAMGMTVTNMPMMTFISR